MVPVAVLLASVERLEQPASRPAEAAVVSGLRLWVRPVSVQPVPLVQPLSARMPLEKTAPQASVVQPVFQAAGYLSVRLPFISLKDYVFPNFATGDSNAKKHTITTW